MGKKYIIHDVLEAFLEDTDTTDTYFFGATTSSSVEKAVSQEMIKAGINNKTIGMIQADDGMTFSVTTGLHYNDVYELQFGKKFEESAEIEVQEITEAEDGTTTATSKTVSGDLLDLSAESLPKNHKVQLKTVVYDPDTNVVVADLYWIFSKAISDGNLADTFEPGSNKTNELNFTCLVPLNGSSYGQLAIVPREQPVV